MITASTGNAGVALAAMAPCAGVEAIIVVPETAPPGKLAQLAIFGARVVLVRGSYDDAFEVSDAAARELGWYCRNTGHNPFTVEGKKTVAFEIAEQLGWRAPDWVAVSVGDGNILVGVHKGFRELVDLGFIERMPKILGVQAEGSSPIARAFERGTDVIEPVETHTLADSIAAGKPADGARALAAVRATGGAFVIVSDQEILDAIAALGADAAGVRRAGGGGGLRRPGARPRRRHRACGRGSGHHRHRQWPQRRGRCHPCRAGQSARHRPHSRRPARRPRGVTGREGKVRP